MRRYFTCKFVTLYMGISNVSEIGPISLSVWAVHSVLRVILARKVCSRPPWNFFALEKCFFYSDFFLHSFLSTVFGYECVLFAFFRYMDTKWMARPTGINMTPNNIAVCVTVLFISVSMLRFHIHRVVIISPITK